MHVRLCVLEKRALFFLQPRAGWKSSLLVEGGEAAVGKGGFIQIRIICVQRTGANPRSPLAL